MFKNPFEELKASIPDDEKLTLQCCEWLFVWANLSSSFGEPLDHEYEECFVNENSVNSLCRNIDWFFEVFLLKAFRKEAL